MDAGNALLGDMGGEISSWERARDELSGGTSSMVRV